MKSSILLHENFNKEIVSIKKDTENKEPIRMKNTISKIKNTAEENKQQII